MILIAPIAVPILKAASESINLDGFDAPTRIITLFLIIDVFNYAN